MTRYKLFLIWSFLLNAKIAIVSRLPTTAKTVSEEKAKHQAMSCALERNSPAVELGSFCESVVPDNSSFGFGILGFAANATWVDHTVMRTESYSVVTGLKNKWSYPGDFFPVLSLKLRSPVSCLTGMSWKPVVTQCNINPICAQNLFGW